MLLRLLLAVHNMQLWLLILIFPVTAVEGYIIFAFIAGFDEETSVFVLST
jgi:hypothetical protein